MATRSKPPARKRRKRHPGWVKASGARDVLIDENKRAYQPVDTGTREVELKKLPDPPTDERVRVRSSPVTKRRTKK